jgi:hypothetical protein
MKRSALVREAPLEYLKHLQTRELEACDRTGYKEHSDVSARVADLERIAAWPERKHAEKFPSINAYEAAIMKPGYLCSKLLHNWLVLPSKDPWLCSRGGSARAGADFAFCVGDR